MRKNEEVQSLFRKLHKVKLKKENKIKNLRRNKMNALIFYKFQSKTIEKLSRKNLSSSQLEFLENMISISN